MERRQLTIAVMEAILKLAATGAVLTVALVAPNVMTALDKPLRKYLGGLDARARRREIRRVAYYMKSQGLISGEYEHGLAITEKGRLKLSSLRLDNIRIAPPPRWDQLWRIVFYDIPEQRKSGRDALTRKLQEIGFFQLQRSVFIHPFACREAIETIATAHSLEKYVTYIETPHLDGQMSLIKRFCKQYPAVKF